MTASPYYVLQSIICLSDGRAAEGVGLDDVSTSLQVLLSTQKQEKWLKSKSLGVDMFA